MPTGFDENAALKRMDGADKGHIVAGAIAGFGRQMRKKAENPKTDYVTMLENQAKMHAFRSGIKMNEMDRASDIHREESRLGHEQSLERTNVDRQNQLEVLGYKHGLGKEMASHEAKVKAKSEKKVIKAKAKSELSVAQGKRDITNEAHAQYASELGGLENRSFEVNPSTGSLKYGVPIKGIGSKEQFNDLPIAKGPESVNLEKYDK